MILTHRAVMTVPTFLIMLFLTRVQESPAAKLKCCEIHETMRILGNVFDCQQARRDHDELHNDSRNLATSFAILRTEGNEKSESEEPLQSKSLSCFQGRARQNKSRRWKVSSVYD